MLALLVAYANAFRRRHRTYARVRDPYYGWYPHSYVSEPNQVEMVGMEVLLRSRLLHVYLIP